MVEFVATYDSHGVEVPLSIAAFRHDFVNSFKDFTTEVNVMATGHASFNNSWRDDFGVQGIVIGAAAIDGVVSILAAVGILTATVSAAISIPLAIVGAISVFAYQKWRDDKKEKEYIRAENKLARVGIMDEIEKIADLLIDLYRMQLESCTVKDAVKMAESLFKAISSGILKNESFYFDELLQPALLQGVLLRSSLRMPNIKLNMNTRDTLYYSTREMVSKPALYCREDNKFYENNVSDARKYGVLFFDKKNELDDYMKMADKIKGGDKSWEYKDMTAAEVSLLQNRSLFRPYRDDKMFVGGEVGCQPSLA